jgi:hypothetical protein
LRWCWPLIMMEKLMLRRWRCCGWSGVKNGLKQAQELLDQLQRPSTVWMSNWKPFKGATRISTRWEKLDFRLQEVITRALYKGHSAPQTTSHGWSLAQRCCVWPSEGRRNGAVCVQKPRNINHSCPISRECPGMQMVIVKKV